MDKHQTDEELVASAKNVAYKNMCKSVIVATGFTHARPEGRNYYHCDMTNKPHPKHYNGYDKWWIDPDTGEWKFEGDSLKDPFFGGAQP